ncbi:MAG: AMP-binding protein [Rhizobiaceae bacterium]
MDAFPQPTDFANVHDFFMHTAAAFPERPFMRVVAETAAIYGIEAGGISYGDMAARVDERRRAYERAGYGAGRRVGLLLENRPVFFDHWLALNGLGASIIPINPDLRQAELDYLIGHSEMDLAVAIASRHGDLKAAGAKSRLKVVDPDDEPPAAAELMTGGPADGDIEAALLYTSGTTGLPKGCVLDNSYFLNCGHWYRNVGGHCALTFDGERMITPLPLFHMNALACSTMGMVAVGGCLTVLDRFHPKSWWKSVRETQATVVHYLGVMPAMLMGAPAAAEDRAHDVRFGFGAGVDRTLHAPFEERFGFPLIEAWAMTETGNGAVIAASDGERNVGSNCFGTPAPQVEVRIETDGGDVAATGEPGELLVRRAGADPRYGFFDRYLKDEAATAEAWRGGWFHTGDIVRRNDDGSFSFVDRKKNVIRRSGENIAAIEVEGVLNRHPAVEASAVAATPDPVRGEEVFACIVRAEPEGGGEAAALAGEIAEWCLTQLAYYKAPGFIAFVDRLPLTSTNKVQRGELKGVVAALRDDPATIDLCHLKKRKAA